jgi:hypothetical protein
MKALRGVLCSVAWLASACGLSHHAAVDQDQVGAAGGQSVVSAGRGAGGQPAAGDQTALSDANRGGAGASGTLAGASAAVAGVGASGAAPGGATAVASDMVSVEQVTRDCTETLQCDGLAGATGDAVANCVATELDLLNKSPADMQLRFKQVVEACDAFKSCEYLACVDR